MTVFSSHLVMIRSCRIMLVVLFFFALNTGAAIALDTDAMTEKQRQELIEAVDPAEIRKLADSGDAMMQYVFGWMLMKGVNVEKDMPRGTAYVEKAAKGGIGEAQYIVGSLFEYGHAGYPKDLKKAIGWYEKGIARGNTKAMVNLAYMYQDGKGLPINDRRAIALFNDAAKAGDSRAQMVMAMRFFNGNGVPRDASDGLKWLRASAARGYADAQAVLGTILVQGVFSEPNHEEGAIWLKKAANQGQPIAQSNLGDLYFAGYGVRKDAEMALHWYQQAESKGVQHAIDAIRRMKERGLLPE